MCILFHNLFSSNNFSYSLIMFLISKSLALSFDLLSLFIASIIPSANAIESSTGTSKPYLFSPKISLGPLLQSVATTLQPQAKASSKELGNPSHLDDNTYTSA